MLNNLGLSSVKMCTVLPYFAETLIISEYDVDEQQVKADLRTILDTFNEYGIIEYI